jgi:rhamnose transport system ATP-binding protein
LRPEDPVLGMSVADQQIVEIIKALTFEAKVLIMDEPTAALSLEEVKRLFQVIERLRLKGVAVMFVSHRLDEVFAISQRITVMRDGRVIGSGPIEEWTTEEVIRKMVGRSLDALYPKEKVEPGEVVLRVRDMRRAGVFKDISFDVRKGEIVCLAGLVGAGRSEVARAIFGIDALDSGEIFVAGTPLRDHTPQQAMAAGIGLVPEDRQQQGLVTEMTTVRNVTLTVLRQVRRIGLVSRKKERQIAGQWTERMDTRDGQLKMLAAEGESVPGPILEIGNTNSRYRFPIGARRFVNDWNARGPAHHCAIGVGHVTGKLKKLASLLQTEITQVC